MSPLRPLQLTRALTAPDRRLDMTPLLDLLLLALMVMMLGSPFVVAPGLSVELEGGLVLPVGSPEILAGVPVVEVLTARGPDSFFFQGRFLTLSELELLARPPPGSVQAGAVLLLRAHESVTLDVLVRLADWARSWGFSRVQVAARPVTPSTTFSGGRGASP